MALATLAAALGQHTPAAYYRFENTSDATIDSRGLCPLVKQSGSSAAPQVQDASATSVGNFLVFNYGAHMMPAAPIGGTGRAWRAESCAPRAGVKGVTIELLLHPTPQCFLRGGTNELLRSTDAAANYQMSISYNELRWTARSDGDAPDGGTLTVPFQGEGVLASDYFWSDTTPAGTWHHIALVRDAVTGAQSVWIDGESQPAMQTNGTAGTAMKGAGVMLDATNPVCLCAGVDELAIYEEALPPSMIYAHYQDMKAKVPYRTADPGGAVPTATYPNGSNASYYDLTEYPEGTVLPSPGWPKAPRAGGGGNSTVCDGCMSSYDQIAFAPDPRFDAAALASYKTPFNFNWMDPWTYMAGKTVPKSELFNVTEAMMSSLATKWRYGYQLQRGANLNKTIATANAQPQWPLHAIIGGERCKSGLFNATLPKGCYMQNAAGQFITVKGDLIPAGEPPTLRVMAKATADAQGCPDSIFNACGAEYSHQYGFDQIDAEGQLKRPFDVVNSDGEVFIGLMSHRTPPAPAEFWDYSLDPVCKADYEASGAPNWETFFSQWRTRLTNGFSQQLMAGHESTIFKGTKFSQYQVQGDTVFFGNWSVTRHIGDPWPDAATGNDSYYSAVDFYLQHPSIWWTGAGPDHGVEWLNGVRRSERALGDELYAPFLSAGWSQQAERNLRPAQWLGLLKIMAVWGAEWFYAGFFSLRQPFQPAENWAWQALAPVYAQAAIVSQASDYFYQGTLVANDPNTSFAMGDTRGHASSPLLWAGAPNVLAVARELHGAYLLVATIQRLSNNARNLKSVGRTGRPCDVHIPGLASPVKVAVRAQGSSFVVTPANASADGNPTVTQLDSWHEASHPTLWSASSATYEAELFVGWRAGAGKALVATELAAGATHPYDFVGSTTYVDLRAAAAVRATAVNAAAAQTCIRVHPAAARDGKKQVRVGPRMIKVRARRGAVRVNGGAALVAAEGAGWQWLGHAEWAVERATGEVDVCIDGDAQVDAVEVQGC